MQRVKLYSILFSIAISSVCISSLLYVWSYHSANQSTFKLRPPYERNPRNKSEQIERLKPLVTDLTSTASLSQKTHLKSQQNESTTVNLSDSLVQTKAPAQIDARATESKSKTPVIPLIFHQIYKDTSLPAPYGICLYSLLRNHRFRDGRRERKAGEFDYYFWTDQSIKEYREDGVKQKVFANFNSARETIEVTDMLRYFFLYEFGGIYLDLDMEPVNPFLPLLERGYPCILSEENPIQVNKGFGATFGVTNSIMMCRPRHPFFKLLIEMLPEFKNRGHIVFRTGPRFVTAVFERYQTADKKRADECAKDATSRDDCIFIAPSHIFETLHNINTHPFKDLCRQRLKGANADAIARDGVLRYCRYYIDSIEQRGTAAEFENNLERLAVHHYLHMGYRTGADRNCAANTFELRNLLRGYWIYEKAKGFTFKPSGLE